MPSDKILPSNRSDIKPISNLGAVVLCGGKSTRMKIDKSQLIFRDQTFLERIVDQVAKVSSQVVLVGDTDFDKHRLAPGILLAQDARPESGPLEGIRIGLKRLAQNVEYAFVTSCDVPLLKPELIVRLFTQIVRYEAIVPFQGKRRFGMSAIYRTELHDAIDRRIVAGQLRVSDLADAFETNLIDVELLKEVDPELDSLTNINSASDYQELLDRFGMECSPEIARKIALANSKRSEG